jgi:hypothetical protein
MDSDYHVQDVTLSIANQNMLSGATYDQIQQLITVDLPITRDNFIRVWKTLILKRCQDVFEQEKHHRADHFIRINRNILVPAPLSDLLYMIGQHHSNVTGVIYDSVPPAHAANPPPWWAVDNDLVQQWCLMVNRLKTNYLMREFPSMTDYTNKPLMLTSLHDNEDLRSIKAFTNEPKPADALIRFVNDPLYDPVPHAYDACHLRMTEQLALTTIRYCYVGAYVINSNS